MKILRDHDRQGQGLMQFEDFSKVGMYGLGATCQAHNASRLTKRTIASSLTFTVTERILARDPLDEIRRAFRLFDNDGTGRISLRDLKRVAKELGENLDDEELQAMIEEFDLDQDGEISEAEFVRDTRDMRLLVLADVSCPTRLR